MKEKFFNQKYFYIFVSSFLLLFLFSLNQNHLTYQNHQKNRETIKILQQQIHKKSELLKKFHSENKIENSKTMDNSSFLNELIRLSEKTHIQITSAETLENKKIKNVLALSIYAKAHLKDFITWFSELAKNENIFINDFTLTPNDEDTPQLLININLNYGK